MSDQQTLLERLGNLFRRNGRDGDLPLSDTTHALEHRSTFLRPWAKRDAAINNLQEGFTTLTDLMSTIRQGLEQQSKRQDELLAYLSHLPEALRTLPETSRVHGETLRAIHQQLEQQNIQQDKLTEILDRVSNNSSDQRKTLDEVRDLGGQQTVAKRARTPRASKNAALARSFVGCSSSRPSSGWAAAVATAFALRDGGRRRPRRRGASSA